MALKASKNSVVYIHVRLQRCAWSVEKLLSRFSLGSNVRKLLLWSCFGLRKINRQVKKKKVDVGEGEEKAITVVTNDSKVREGDRLIVARIGARVPASSIEEEETIVVKKTSVAGTHSEGMLCDAQMLQWGNGSNPCS